ncbi:MAG TPA: N-acetyltransferase [Terriglobales bacterium]|nr:N-acetyltransferase [Terriglobales bacterium]
MKITLRDFRPEDFEALWHIDQQCFAPEISYSRTELAAYLRRRRAFALVADAEGSPVVTGAEGLRPGEFPPSIVGFIVAEADRSSTGHIITIDVLPTVRRAGVGSQLLRAAEDRLRAADSHCAVLETAVDNRAALSFYKAHAYSVVKTVPRYYSNGVDALVLKKDLLSPPEPAKLPQ